MTLGDATPKVGRRPWAFGAVCVMLGDAARGHGQHTNEGAEQTEVATCHEAAVGTDISFPDSPQPCRECAERESWERMEPVEPAVNGPDSEEGQHHDVHGGNPDPAYCPMKVAAFGPTQQVYGSKDECIAGSHCVHSDQDGPRGRHTPERSGPEFPGLLRYGLPVLAGATVEPPAQGRCKEDSAS